MGVGGQKKQAKLPSIGREDDHSIREAKLKDDPDSPVSDPNEGNCNSLQVIQRIRKCFGQGLTLTLNSFGEDSA